MSAQKKPVLQTPSVLEVAAITVRVNNLDLGPIKMKLMLPSPEGKGWDEEQAEASILWYKRYITLCALYPSESLVPNGPIDEVWHTHILDTMKYAEDCVNVLGYFLHHYPYFGLNGDADVRDDMFDRTNDLYQEHFGEDCRSLNALAWPCAGKSCSGKSCGGGRDPGGCSREPSSCGKSCGSEPSEPSCSSKGSNCGHGGGGTGCGQGCSRK